MRADAPISRRSTRTSPHHGHQGSGPAKFAEPSPVSRASKLRGIACSRGCKVCTPVGSDLPSGGRADVAAPGESGYRDPSRERSSRTGRCGGGNCPPPCDQRSSDPRCTTGCARWGKISQTVKGGVRVERCAVGRFASTVRPGVYEFAANQVGRTTPSVAVVRAPRPSTYGTEPDPGALGAVVRVSHLCGMEPRPATDTSTDDTTPEPSESMGARMAAVSRQRQGFGLGVSEPSVTERLRALGSLPKSSPRNRSGAR